MGFCPTLIKTPCLKTASTSGHVRSCNSYSPVCNFNYTKRRLVSGESGHFCIVSIEYDIWSIKCLGTTSRRNGQLIYFIRKHLEVYSFSLVGASKKTLQNLSIMAKRDYSKAFKKNKNAIVESQLDEPTKGI